MRHNVSCILQAIVFHLLSTYEYVYSYIYMMEYYSSLFHTKSFINIYRVSTPMMMPFPALQLTVFSVVLMSCLKLTPVQAL